MMARTLTSTVVLTNPRTRLAETFRPGEPVPGWAAKLITNPAAWGDSSEHVEPEHVEHVHGEFDDREADGDKPEEESAESEGDKPAGGDAEDTEALPEPPRAGRGSSLEAWQSYADALGIEYANDASRDDIITAVDTARS